MLNNLKVRLFGVLLLMDIVIEYFRSLTTEMAMSIDNTALNGFTFKFRQCNGPAMFCFVTYK